MSVLQTGIGPEKGFYPYAIDQSLRFNDDDSAYLSRTPATAGNRKTWTWSGWVKRASFNEQFLFGVSNAGNNDDFTNLQFFDGRINFSNWTGGINVYPLAELRDPSAWYHVVLKVDTTQPSASDRVIIYLNGSALTDLGSANYPSQNSNLPINTTKLHHIGARLTSGALTTFDGYLAEINFIDGQALDPTSFGEFKSGVWVANKYTGTYGTNGFYLPFTNGLGDDESGNGNDWTPNNLAATDIVLDSPTNNFATLNPLDLGGNGTLANGNLDWSVTSGDDGRCYSTIAMSSRKWYWEITQTDPDRFGTGIVNISEVSTVSLSNDIGGSEYEWGFVTDGQKRNNSDASSYGSSIGNGGVLMVAFDADNGELYFGKDGTWFDSSNPATNTSPAYSGLPTGDYLVAVTRQSGDNSATFEFGQGGFTYTPPTDYLALSTANLPEPAISPADDASPSDYFNTVLYTGNGTSQTITGVGFDPDTVWCKSRSNAENHNIFDIVRGDHLRLKPNDTEAEFDTVDDFSFESDGFFVGNRTETNGSGQSYVAWNWKANGAGVTNTDGSITSTVSASPESGFSIVEWTGDGNASVTLGHGLDQAPELIFYKGLESTFSWPVWFKTFGTSTGLFLDTTNASGAFGRVTSVPTSTVISNVELKYTNELNKRSIAYCFHSVEGYSAFGSYTGNGSTDGPFVYTGFRPAFVMIKRTDTSENWYLHDKLRAAEYNPQEEVLLPNSSNAAQLFGDKDFVSNGFKIRDTASGHNASGGTYIYACFAENPFKYSLAR